MKPVTSQFDEARHLDLQADLHVFFNTLVHGKRVLDVGAGLGRSKARVTSNAVTTYEPSPYCRAYVDTAVLPTTPFDVVTAFEVLEHVEDDLAFLRQLDALATQAIFLTTPNWYVARCQSDYHYREYTPDEFVTTLRIVWPRASIRWFCYYKNARGGWCQPVKILRVDALKFAALIDKSPLQ